MIHQITVATQNTFVHAPEKGPSMLLHREKFLKIFVWWNFMTSASVVNDVIVAPAFAYVMMLSNS